MILKEIRSALKLSQQKLSDKIGVPKGRIAQWEVGNGTPKIEDLEKIGKLFLENQVVLSEHDLKPKGSDSISRYLGYQFAQGAQFNSIKTLLEIKIAEIIKLFDVDISFISKKIWQDSEFLSHALKGIKPIHPLMLDALDRHFPTAASKSIRKPKTETKEEVIPAFDQVVAQQGKMIESLIPTTETDKAGLVKKEMFKNAQFVIRSSGNSMIPNYPPDAWIGIRKIDPKLITPGSVYAIDIGSDLIIKRVYYKDDDQYSGFITCISDNTMVEDFGARKGRLKYPPYEIDMQDIRGVYKVTDIYRPNEITVLR